MRAGELALAEGRYRLERQLGAGGMASVWLGHDERLGRPVAVKLIADTLAGDFRWTRRFEREARAAAALAHPGVVSVFDYGVEDGRPFLVMEYIDGGTLAQRLAGSGPLPGAEQVAAELLEALGAVHAAGIVHRDVKPSNLLLDPAGHLRLTDFGIARPSDATRLTETGLVIGTMRYLAPELLAGQPASVRSDLYAAGVVIGEVAEEHGARARGREDKRIARLVEALTAVDPRARPASAAAALSGLKTPPPAHPAGTGLNAPPAVTGSKAPAPATAPTRVRAPGRLPRVSAELRRQGLSPRLVYAIVGLLAVALVIAVIAAGSRSSSPRAAQASTPAPAPASAPLATQLRSLGRIVDAATRR